MNYVCPSCAYPWRQCTCRKGPYLDVPTPTFNARAPAPKPDEPIEPIRFADLATFTPIACRPPKREDVIPLESEPDELTVDDVLAVLVASLKYLAEEGEEVEICVPLPGNKLSLWYDTYSGFWRTTGAAKALDDSLPALLAQMKRRGLLR